MRNNKFLVSKLVLSIILLLFFPDYSVSKNKQVELTLSQIKQILKGNRYFDNQDLSRLSLAGIDLSKTGMHSTNLDSANLSKANLNDAFLVSTSLNDANIRDANMSGIKICLLYTSPSPRDRTRSRMPSSA